MKILLVRSYSFKSGQTGDATQGRETANALVRAGVELICVYVKYQPIRIIAENDAELTESQVNDLIDSCDAVHFLPASIPLCRFWRKLHKKPVLGSSIFWGGLERVCVAWCTYKRFIPRLIASVKELRNMVPFYMDYHGVDVFLPNSEAEGRRVMQCFGTDKDATYKVVPNGFVLPALDVCDLPRSTKVPQEDYIVVPGVFARRKNQIGLIRALNNYHRNYKVVFMGGGTLDEDYYNECQSVATDDMVFLGYVNNKQREYWQVLRHARIACLPSDCETPGIAMIEAAYAGARPVITKFGGTDEYYGEQGEYLNPCFSCSIVDAIDRGWRRGRLKKVEAECFARFSWDLVATKTKDAYQFAIETYG